MKKKIWLTLGATLASLIPITATIACGSNASKSISEDEIKRKEEERRLEDLAREKARKNRAAKVEKENLINNFYENVRSSMPSRHEVKFNKFGDPDWDNNIDLANYGNLSLKEINDKYNKTSWNLTFKIDFDDLGTFNPPYISPIETMAEKFISKKDETQFFTLDEAINYINNANSSEYETIINWLDKKAKTWSDTDDVIITELAKLNKQLDQEISKNAANDLKIANLSAEEKAGYLELKITLDSPIFTNADLDLDTTEPLEFKYNISGSNFLHPSFKNLLNKAVKIQKVLNDANLELNLDKVPPRTWKELVPDKHLETQLVDKHLETQVDNMFLTNKKTIKSKGVWPIWKGTTSLYQALTRIQDEEYFKFDSYFVLNNLPDEIKNYQVIGAKLNWSLYDISGNSEWNNIEIYFLHDKTQHQYYSLKLPFKISSKIYIDNNYLYNPVIVFRDKSIGKIFKKTYFEGKNLTKSEQQKIDNFVTQNNFDLKLQKALTRPDGVTFNAGGTDDLKAFQIVIWDEEKEGSKYLKVTLKDPHLYESGETISWKKDFEPYLLVEDEVSCKEIANKWID